LSVGAYDYVEDDTRTRKRKRASRGMADCWVYMDFGFSLRFMIDIQDILVRFLDIGKSRRDLFQGRDREEHVGILV
jgi:hypothetical protein